MADSSHRLASRSLWRAGRLTVWPACQAIGCGRQATSSRLHVAHRGTVASEVHAFQRWTSAEQELFEVGAFARQLFVVAFGKHDYSLVPPQHTLRAFRECP